MLSNHIIEYQNNERSEVKYIFRKTLFYVLVITLFGAFLRFYHLGFKSLWLDEAVIYLNSLGSISEIIQKNALRNSAPPTFTLLIRLITCFGNSEFWLRVPSCIAGILSIPVMYLAFKDYAGKRGATLGCLLLAISPVHIKYSQQVREYSFVVLLTLLLCYCMTKVIQKKDVKQFLLFGITAAISILFQYGLALVVMVLSIIIFVCLIKNEKRKLGRFVLSFIPIILSLLLVYSLSLKHQYRSGGFAASSYLSNAYFDGNIANLPTFFINNTESVFRFSFNSECKFILLLLWALGFFYCLRQKQYLPLLVFFGLFGFIFIVAIFSLYPYSGIRQTIFLSVPLYLIVSIGTRCLEKKFLHFVIIILFGAFIFYGAADSFRYLKKESRENMKSIVKILNNAFHPDDRIFVSSGSVPAFQYYLNSLSGHSVFPLDFYDKQNKKDYTERIESLTTHSGCIWLLFTHYKQKNLDNIINAMQKKRSIRLVSPPDDYTRLYMVMDENLANKR